MAKTEKLKKQHKTMRGRLIDMDLIRKKNELTPAVGNVRVNARGDELGPGGKIIKKRESIIKDQYVRDGLAVEEVKKKLVEEVVDSSSIKETVDSVKSTTTTSKKTTSTKKITEQLSSHEKELLEDDWIEDKDGNFVKKEK